MRVILRHPEIGLYYAGRKHWVGSPGSALDLGTIERAWAVLTDLERIAPCLPGAQLREVEGDEYRGAVKIKVGPITTSYDGAIRFTELDESAHHAVLRSEERRVG